MSYGYIQNYNALVAGMLNLHNIDSKSYEYNVFREKLGRLAKNSPSPSAYTPEQIKLLLKETRSESKDLYKLIIFLTYTGCKLKR